MDPNPIYMHGLNFDVAASCSHQNWFLQSISVLDSGRIPAKSYNSGPRIMGGTFRFLFLISTSRYVFFNKGHLGLHISDSYTPNCVIQALAPVIHYRYSLDKYSIVLKLVNFNISYLRSHFALFQPFYVL